MVQPALLIGLIFGGQNRRTPLTGFLLIAREEFENEIEILPFPGLALTPTIEKRSPRGVSVGGGGDRGGDGRAGVGRRSAAVSVLSHVPGGPTSRKISVFRNGSVSRESLIVEAGFPVGATERRGGEGGGGGSGVRCEARGQLALR